MTWFARNSTRCRTAAARLGACLIVLGCANAALGETLDASEEKVRRNTFTWEPTLMGGGPPPKADIAGTFQYQRVVSPRLAWLAGLKVRMLSLLIGGETIAAVEAVGGARWFPGGRAPKGFFLGGNASLGVGAWLDRTSTLFGGEAVTRDGGGGVTWSTVGQLGYQWVSSGGFLFGLHLDVGGGTTSLQERQSGLYAGYGYSIGGAW